VIFLAGLIWGLTPAIIPPQPTPQPVVVGGEDLDMPRDEISPAEEQAMWEEIQRNIATLRDAGALAVPNAAQTVTYNIP